MNIDGRKADIWSMGITLCEMAAAKAPFQNAASAIFAVCVSKSFPRFPDRMSKDAHIFLEHCLVENVKQRANCKELLKLGFLKAQVLFTWVCDQLQTCTLYRH